MKTLRRILAAAVLLVGPVAAQNLFPYIASTGRVSVSGAAYAATLQMPAATCGTSGALACGKLVTFPSSAAPGGGAPPGGAANSAGLAIMCSVACVASIISNGTAATGSTTTINPVPGSGGPPPLIQLFANSNLSGGTTVAAFDVAAGETKAIDMSGYKLPAGGTGVNLTVSIASLTGTVNITFYPLEQH